MADSRPIDTLFPLSGRDRKILLESLRQMRKLVEDGRIVLVGAMAAEFENDISKLERLLR